MAVASCQEYLDGVIKKTRADAPDKEDDRVKHIEYLNAQTGNVFLAYRAVLEMDALTSRVTAQPPEIDFIGTDGVRHSSWTVADDATIAAIHAIFAAVPSLYIADGHHRTAAAGRVVQDAQRRWRKLIISQCYFPAQSIADSALQSNPEGFERADPRATPGKTCRRFRGDTCRFLLSPRASTTLGLLSGRRPGMASVSARNLSRRPRDRRA